jgi:hypothetical protein
MGALSGFVPTSTESAQVSTTVLPRNARLRSTGSVHSRSVATVACRSCTFSCQISLAWAHLRVSLTKPNICLHPTFRDFSNGYLVAEILSKYDMGEISMHSFQNSTSTEEKKGNWVLIQKFLRAHGINLTSETTESIMSQDQAAVDRFLQHLFLCGTHPCTLA